MASHDGKRRSHQRFLRNLPKQKPGEYLKSCTLLSGGSRPCAREGEDGEVFCRLPYRLLFPLRFLFFFFTQNKEGGSGLGRPGLSPRSGTALARVGLIATYSLFWAGLSEKGLTLILV